MNRGIMYSNKILHQKEVEHRQRLHREKLATIKPTSQSNARPTLDLHTPLSMSMKHMKYNPKKHKAEQERLDAIQRENKALLQRMYNIMRQSVGGDAVEYGPGVRINKHQVPITDSYVSASTNMKGSALPLESVNFERRRREQAEIMRENRALLARITHRRSEYDHKRWAAQRSKNEEYMTRIRKDDTAGYLPQGKEGHSVFYRPQGLSMSTARLPSLGTSSSLAGTAEGDFVTYLQTGGASGSLFENSRASTASSTTRRRKGRGKGRGKVLTPYEAPVSPITSRPGSGKSTASRTSRGSAVPKPSSDWLASEQARKILTATVALRLATVSRTASGSDAAASLVVDEIPSSSPRFMKGIAVSVEGSSRPLELSADSLLDFVAKSSASETVGPALRELVEGHEDPATFPSLVAALSEDVRHHLAVALSRRLVIGEDGVSLSWVDEEESHGEKAV